MSGGIARGIVKVTPTRLKSGAGAFLDLECGHKRFVGGYVAHPARTFHGCLDCEFRESLHNA